MLHDPRASALVRPAIHSLTHLHSGKVRDLYAIDAERMLIVASDRMSAFDVVLPTPIPGKGFWLTELSNFWFHRTRHIVANHLLDDNLDAILSDDDERRALAGRATVARRLRPLPIEAIVRGHIIGSGWRDYQAKGRIGDVTLPAGLRLADRLPEPIFTPSTKAGVGDHDENIGFAEMRRLIGARLADKVREVSLRLYREAAEHARGRGIIIADTKFEFGLDAAGQLVLIDEALTPDSSRFWPLASWNPGENPPSFDKQFVRDWLEAQEWNKKPPGPELPPEIVERTRTKYRDAVDRLTAGT